MRLETPAGVFRDPTPDDIEGALEGIELRGDGFASLHRSGSERLRVARDGFEMREQGRGFAFSPAAFDRDLTRKLLLSYARQDDQWRKLVAWQARETHATPRRRTGVVVLIIAIVAGVLGVTAWVISEWSGE